MGKRKRRRWRKAPSPAPGSSAAVAGSSAVATVEPEPAFTVGDEAPVRRQRRSWRELTPLLMVRAAHPRQAVITAVAVAVAGALSGRAPREIGLILATVLVGQSIIGWHNDLVDRKRDAANEVPKKPLATGLLDPGAVWFWLTCALLLVVPLAIGNGVWAGLSYLGVVVLSLLGNLVLRRGRFSWVPWAASYALYPAFLSYGGWAYTAEGNPPEITVTVLAGLLGICVHFLRALPGLVADNRDGWRHLPLRLALRIGAPRLLWISIAVTVLVVAGLVVEGSRVGLAQ